MRTTKIFAKNKYFIQPNHRRRIYVEAKANSRRWFLGENGGPLRLCSRRIGQGGLDQNKSNICFDEDSSVPWSW